MSTQNALLALFEALDDWTDVYSSDPSFEVMCQLLDIVDKAIERLEEKEQTDVAL